METLTEQGLKLAKEYGLELTIANTIRSPGRFEGEHVIALVFYEAMLNGDCGCTQGDNWARWDLDDNERKELDGAHYYEIEISNDGFVYGTALPRL